MAQAPLTPREIVPNDSRRFTGFKVLAVRVPMAEQTADGVLVLTDVGKDAGISGHGIVFADTPMALEPTCEWIQNFGALRKGERPAPFDIEQSLAGRFRLPGIEGVADKGMAIAGDAVDRGVDWNEDAVRRFEA